MCLYVCAVYSVLHMVDLLSKEGKHLYALYVDQVGHINGKLNEMYGRSFSCPVSSPTIWTESRTCQRKLS